MSACCSKTCSPVLLKKATINSLIWFPALISIFHSLLEEYYWRWFVYGNLREVVSIKMAHFLAAFTFTLHHIVVMMQFFELPWALFFSACVGVGGFFWSLLYQHQKTLIGAWVSHALVDAALMSVGYYMIVYWILWTFTQSKRYTFSISWALHSSKQEISSCYGCGWKERTKVCG